MADIITPILNIVSVLCSCSANNRCCYLLDLQENKDALNTAMEELKDARDDVKTRVDEAENNPNEPMKCNQEVSGWLQRVQAIEGEVVQVIQKADQDIKGRCFGGYCPKNCWSARKIGKLVIRKLDIVNNLRSKGSFVDVAYKLPPALVQKEPVDLTVGMESMFDKVLKSLAEDEVRIMGLYGYGGVGKTTLLKQINNEFLKSTTSSTHGFNVVILVVVSKAVNIDAIQKEIGKRLGLSSPDRTNICNALTRRNFLLLLDDIWERVDLQSIGVPRPDENNKSKVVFTTRSETVCGLMEANKMLKVQCLPWNEAWSLFQEKVGEVALNSFQRASELAKDVARECGGLPLALITIGRAMSTKKTVQEWNHAITTLRKAASNFPGMGDQVLPRLKLSYDSLLDNTIKSCFLYCALFPEDESIDKAKLIDYWIGEGLILINEFDHIDEARNHGYDVIGILKGACLLESGRYEETHVKMHDTIRDLALWIACECGSKNDKMLIIESFNGMSERVWYNAERIYLIPLSKDATKVPLNSPNLLTLLCLKRPCHVRKNFFEFMPLLRVLDLSGSNIKIFPTSITELLELRYLSLSETHIEVLPDELRKLVKLNYLDLSVMRNLKRIPSGVIGSLFELRVLNLCFKMWNSNPQTKLQKFLMELKFLLRQNLIPHLETYRAIYACDGVDWDVEQGYNLKHLNDLRISIKTQHNLNKLLSNKNLQMCTRHLHLCSPSSSPSPLPASSTTTLGVDGSRIKSLEKLELLFNLETLLLEFLPKTELMNMNIGVWNENHFQNLSEIQIHYCKAFKDLTWVGYLGNLKTLDVRYCEELEEIVVIGGVDDFGGTGGGDEIISSSKKKNKMMNKVEEDVFKRLQRLSMFDLPKLKSICSHALAFPCLEYMFVSDCPELKKLPLDSRSNVNNTLRMIIGGPKWWSELQWEEEEDHNNELLKSKFLPYFLGNSCCDADFKI